MAEWGHHLTGMRARAPLVHNITNYVAMNVMANVLLAAGASPAMVHAVEEAAEFTPLAAALTINVGTPSVPWVHAMQASARAAQEAGLPWVLDPVAVAATAFRRAAVARLIDIGPTAIRGNASEILSLSGETVRGKGADSVDPVAAAEDGARALARRTGAVVAVTGPVDFVTDGAREWRVANGHPLMPQVTALGCSLTGLVGAFLAGAADPAQATVAALAYFGLAGERAGAVAAGPGSFQVALLDALAAITPEDLDAAARVEAA